MPLRVEDLKTASGEWIYLGKRTTCHVGGERGVLKWLHRLNPGDIAVGALVRLDLRPVMLYVNLGQRHGDYHAEVTGWHEMTVEEFDRITGITDVRLSLGWDFAYIGPSGSSTEGEET